MDAKPHLSGIICSGPAKACFITPLFLSKNASYLPISLFIANIQELIFGLVSQNVIFIPKTKALETDEKEVASKTASFLYFLIFSIVCFWAKPGHL